MYKPYLRLAVCSVLLILSGCEKSPEAPLLPRPALVAVVKHASIAPTMALVGEVRPRYESKQAFRIAGKIVARSVDVGAVVHQGQRLAQLDAADMQLAAATAQANVRVAEAEYTLAQAELERQTQLFTKQFISAAALDHYQAKFKTAQAQVMQTKAQAAVALNQSQYTALVADRSGIVTAIHAEPGQVVAVGEPIAQIADTQAVDVVVAVPESRIRQLQIQTAVNVKLWANRQKIYPAHVREITPAADSATREFTVRISVDKPDADLKWGMTAGVSFPAEVQKTASVLIPSAALTEIDGQKTVWVIDNHDTAQPRAVTTGPFTEMGVAVISGLQAGETIAVAGVHTLVAGQEIKPITVTAQ